MGQVFKLWMRLIKEHILRERRSSFSSLETMGEKGRGESFQDLFWGSTEFRRSEFVEPIVKIHVLDDGYAWIQKRRDFIEDPKEEISGNQNFWD